TWNNTAGTGDNNTDTISAVTVNFSQFGGGAAVTAANSSGTWTATYVIEAGSIEQTNRNVSVTATDNAGNATTTGDTTSATVDNIRPTVSIGSPSAILADTGPITFTVTYTGASAVTLSSGNVTLNAIGTDLPTGTVAMSGSGTSTRTVTISSITGVGTLGISLAAGTASDAAGNAALAAGPSTTFAVDNGAPDCTFTFPTAAYYNAAGWVAGTITGTATDAGSDLTSVQVSVYDGTNYWNTSAFDSGIAVFHAATLVSPNWSLSFPANLLLDGKTYTVRALATDTLSHTVDTVTTFTYDTAQPTVTINQGAEQSDPTGNSPINFTVVFSEPVSGFTGSDVTLTGTAVASTAWPATRPATSARPAPARITL
ncbi:MAG: hypothetical protein NTY19_25030, partial [Planctomycetota bacterium]|nr:hypothetical protein [Planctomycetota bacterium]